MGSTVYGQQNIQNETVAYFHNLYKLDNPRLRAKLMGSGHRWGKW